MNTTCMAGQSGQASSLSRFAQTFSLGLRRLHCTFVVCRSEIRLRVSLWSLVSRTVGVCIWSVFHEIFKCQICHMRDVLFTEVEASVFGITKAHGDPNSFLFQLHRNHKHETKGSFQRLTQPERAMLFFRPKVPFRSQECGAGMGRSRLAHKRVSASMFQASEENKFIVFILNNRITETLRSGLRELKENKGRDRKSSKTWSTDSEIRGRMPRMAIANNNRE